MLYIICNMTTKDIFNTDHVIGLEETIPLLLMIAFFLIILQTLFLDLLSWLFGHTQLYQYYLRMNKGLFGWLLVIREWDLGSHSTKSENVWGMFINVDQQVSSHQPFSTSIDSLKICWNFSMGKTLLWCLYAQPNGFSWDIILSRIW